MNYFRKIHTIVLILMLVCINSNSFSKDRKYISLATGSITGVYFPMGGAICRFINMRQNTHGVRCSSESTAGSIHNLNGIINEDFDLGIAQSDWKYHAYRGTKDFKNLFNKSESFKKLRSVLALHTETFTLVVREGSGIKKLKDLLGKRVNFGPKNSGTYATMEVLLKIQGWKDKDFSISYLPPIQQAKALCSGKIDAMIYVAGNPNGVIQEATEYNSDCRARIISLDTKTIKKIVRRYPFYVKSVIPGNTYKSNKKDVLTFGIKANLVSSTEVDNKVIYTVTKSFFENFSKLKSLHPVFSSMRLKGSVATGRLAPIHSGAMRYYRESGLIDY